jgi:hypothetical protein
MDFKKEVLKFGASAMTMEKPLTRFAFYAFSARCVQGQTNHVCLSVGVSELENSRTY